jgi:uncharacterized protein (DUF2147 family)
MSRKWRPWTAGLLTAVLVAGHATGAVTDPTFGDWLTQAKNGKVRVGPCAANPAQACGTLVWLVPPPDAPPGPVHDFHNPNPALRSRLLLDSLIISEFRRAAEGRWVDGKIYDPQSGKTYKSKMSVAPDGTLRVSGCVLFFCQAQTWTRVPAA